MIRWNFIKFWISSYFWIVERRILFSSPAKHLYIGIPLAFDEPRSKPFPKRNRIKIAERFTRDHRGQKKALFRSCSSITRGKNARTTESSFSRLVGIEHAERFRSSSDDLSRKEPRWNIHQRILVHSDTGHT